MESRFRILFLGFPRFEAIALDICDFAVSAIRVRGIIFAARRLEVVYHCHFRPQMVLGFFLKELDQGGLYFESGVTLFVNRKIHCEVTFDQLFWGVWENSGGEEPTRGRQRALDPLEGPRLPPELVPD